MELNDDSIPEGPCWIIEPYENHDFDYTVLPAKTEEDHRRALEYAMERMEEQWDECKDGDQTECLVKITFAESWDAWWEKETKTCK